MRSRFTPIIALLYVFGTLGVPIAAYHCVESGEAGVVAYVDASSESCYADVCCDGEEETPAVMLRTGSGCCDLDVQDAQAQRQVLLPEQKSAQAVLPAEHSKRLEAPRADSLLTAAPAADSMLHASISLPLLS